MRHFDVASPGEIRLIRQMFPDAVLHYMHPVKGRQAIRIAYHQYGVRDFVLDSREELDKILEETDGAADLGLVVRLALPKGNAVYDLSGKFGAATADAVDLLRAARAVAPKVGLSFHVGSQMLDPSAYERAIALAGRVIAESGVAIDVLDVGGGFPVSYPGVTPPPLGDFMAAIARGIAAIDCVGDLIGFLDRIWRDRREILRQIPFAATIGVAKPGHDAKQAVDGGLDRGSRRFAHLFIR